MSESAARQNRLHGAVGSVLGLAVALALAPCLRVRPAPDQLPGIAAERGFDPRTGVLRLGLVAALPLLGGALGGRAGARRASATRGALLLPAAAAHGLLVWTFLLPSACLPGIATVGLLAGCLALAVLLALALGGGDAEAGASYLAAACPALPLAFLAARPRDLWLVGAAAAVLLPVLARALSAFVPKLSRILRALAITVLLPGSVVAMAAAAVMQAPRVADVFEDGHALLPASEYLRGERPYRDIVPGHGLVSDGLLAAAELSVFGDDYLGVKRGEKVVGALFWPSFYAVGYAATASPAFGFGGLLSSFLFFPQYQSARPMFSLWTLALALYASRSRRGAAWAGCGALLVLGLGVAVEYAAYAGCGIAVALAVARGDRAAHGRRLLLGAGAGAVALAVVLGASGVLGGFARTTFLFVPALLPVYALGFPSVPLASLGDDLPLLYAFVAVAVVLLGAFLPLAPRVGPRARAVLPVLAWAVAAMLSVLERQHVGYPLLVVPVGLLLLARWLAGRRRWSHPRVLAPAAALAALAAARRPLLLALCVADGIARAPWPEGVTPLAEPRRARGGLFRPGDAALVSATAAMMRRAGFGPDDTWLDFASAPGLYYLFERDCPIRYYEVGFYETRQAQEEVIAAVEGNPRVRAALVSPSLGEIDGVPNAKRAPLVAAYVRERFRPFYREGAVEFWLRREGPDVSGAGRGASATRPR